MDQPVHGTHPAPPRGLTGIPRLFLRQVVVAAVAVGLVVITGLVSLFVALIGPIVNETSTAELCSAYETAQGSWFYSTTEYTDEIDELASLAKRHTSDSIRSAGKELDDLSGRFDYGRYELAARPIAARC